MQLQLEAADAERAEAELAVPLLALVGRLDALDAERRLRVHVGDHLDIRIVLPGRERQELQADGAGGEDDIGVLDRCRRALASSAASTAFTLTPKRSSIALAASSRASSACAR